MDKTQITIRVDEENYLIELKIPNNETRQALNELETRDGKSFDNVNELFADLDS